MSNAAEKARDWFQDWANEYDTTLGKMKRHHKLLDFERMYDNGKKHIFNDGEYCIGFRQWVKLCRDAGFTKVEVTPLKEFEWFKVLVATK